MLRWSVLLAVAAYLTGAVLQVVQSVTLDFADPLPAEVPMLVLLTLPVCLGCLVAWRVPGSPVGAAVAWLGAAPTLVFAVETWGESARSAQPWPGAAVLYQVQMGAWVWSVAGFAALCLVFPDGLLPGRRWRVVAWGAVAAGVFINALQALFGLEREHQPITLPLGWSIVVGGLGFLACLTALSATVASLVVRYRRANATVRQQLRWLMLGAGTVPVLLALGWVLQGLGFSSDVAYVGLFAAMLVAVPVAVAVAVLRYDLFDVDRLLGSSLAWLLTSVASAAVFALVVAAGAELGAGSRVGVTGAAFVTALALLPTHRRLNTLVGRFADRDRYVVVARVAQFVQAVQAGTVEPEEAERVFREVLGDPGARLLLRLPGRDEYVDLTGAPARPPEHGRVPLRSGETEVGVLVLSAVTSRRLRRAREAVFTARLPIEVSRLRLELREALRDVQESRARIVETATEERRRLERDLHDGAQQQIVSVGMRLRSTQRRLDPASAEHRDLDAAVETLEATILELRRLAHGIRPGLLDDGLPAALRALVADAPVPVHLSVDAAPLTDVVTTTAYFVVAEAYANALKHARCTSITIAVAGSAGTVRIEVTDDGAGGAPTGSTSVRDRVASLGGDLTIDSPPGAGTRIAVEIPDAHRPRR